MSRTTPINVIDPSGLESQPDQCSYEKSYGKIKVIKEPGENAQAYWKAEWVVRHWWDNSIVEQGTNFYRLGIVKWLNPGKEGDAEILRNLPTKGPTVRTAVSVDAANSAAGSGVWGWGKPKSDKLYYQKQINSWWGEKTGVEVDNGQGEATSFWAALGKYFGDLGAKALKIVKEAACAGLKAFVDTDVCGIFSRLGACGGFLQAFGSAIREVAGAFLTSGTEIVGKLIDGIKGGFGKLDFNSIIETLGQWLGFEEGGLTEAFQGLVKFFQEGSIGDVLESVLSFFKVSVDSLAQIIQDILPGSDNIILPLFGALETLITEGPQKAGEFVTEVFGEAVNEVTSFVSEFPTLIKDNLGAALQDFLPGLLKDLALQLVGGPVTLVRSFFKVLDGIAGACQDGAAFMTKLGLAVRDAAGGGGSNIAETIYQGIKAALKAVFDMFGKVVGLDKLKKPIQKAKEKVSEGVRKLIKKIVEKMKGILDKLYKKESDDEEEPAFVPVEGEFQSGVKFKITIGDDGEIYVSWNPKCKAKELIKATQEAEQLAKEAPKLKNKLKKSAPKTKKIAAMLETLEAQMSVKNWKRNSNTKCPTQGVWTGEVCNSKFIPCNRKNFGLKEDETFTFNNGWPDFSPWAIDDFAVPGLCGDSRKDRETIIKHMLATMKRKYSDRASLEIALQGNRLHHAGGDRVQIVPQIQHKISHTGGAFELRDKGVPC